MPKPASGRLFKWAGGKTKLLPHYRSLLPQRDDYHKFYEPFAGGAAMFSFLSQSGSLHASLSDVNAEIIGLYRLVRDKPEFLIAEMNRYQGRWLSLHQCDRKAHYYDLRQSYWTLAEGDEATALLYFLMRTGFNGIWQTCKASNGRYATPAGLANETTRVFDEEAVRTWSHQLQSAEILCHGYFDLQPSPRSFIFCDPPYRDSFTSYGTAFDDCEQLRLIDWCRKVHLETGSIVWLSNRDAGDGFFEHHAPDATMHLFPITYTAGRRKKTGAGFEAKQAIETLLIWQ